MFNVGMGLLSANQPSFTPQNPVNSIMQNLQYGAQLKRQQEQDAMRQKLYDIQIAGIERQNQQRQSQANFLMDAYGMGGGQRGNLIATTDATQPYTQNLNALAASGITPEMIKMAATADDPMATFSAAMKHQADRRKMMTMKLWGDTLLKTKPEDYFLFQSDPEAYYAEALKQNFKSPSAAIEQYEYAIKEIDKKNEQIRKEGGTNFLERPNTIKDWLVMLNRAQAHNISIIDNSGTSQTAETFMNERFFEQMGNELDGAETTVNNTRYQLSLLDDLHLRGNDTGFCAEYKQEFARIAGTDADGVATTELFNSSTAEALQAQMAATKGAISDKEMKIFMKLIAGVGKGMLTNYTLVRMRQIVAMQALDMESYFPEFAEKFGQPDGKGGYKNVPYSKFKKWYQKHHDIMLPYKKEGETHWFPTVDFFRDEWEARKKGLTGESGDTRNAVDRLNQSFDQSGSGFTQTPENMFGDTGNFWLDN